MSSSGDTDSVVDQVSARAIDVATLIGGDGFGGPMMMGYMDHAPMHMGFVNESDLAEANEVMHLYFQNNGNQACTFDVSYWNSTMATAAESLEFVVEGEATATVEIACSEIVGLGPLESPGATGCHLDDGTEVDNRMAVPGFHGLDFECGETFQFVLAQDTDDVDMDGDVDEFIVVTDAFFGHQESGGPLGHHHGDEEGMLGPHMGMM